MGKWCLHASSFIFVRIIIKVAGNQDRHKSMVEFEFGPNQTTHFGVTCPWVTKISHFWTWISLKRGGQSWSNFMCSIIGVGERLHKVLGLIDLGTLDSGERSLPFGLLVLISSWLGQDFYIITRPKSYFPYLPYLPLWAYFPGRNIPANSTGKYRGWNLPLNLEERSLFSYLYAVICFIINNYETYYISFFCHLISNNSDFFETLNQPKKTTTLVSYSFECDSIKLSQFVCAQFELRKKE